VAQPVAAGPEPDGDPRELRRFLIGLGGAMTAAGDSVDDVEERLGRVAVAYGVPQATITVLPTYLVLGLGPGDTSSVEKTISHGTLRFDQTAAVFELIDRAERRAVEPETGLRELEAIRESGPRFGGVERLAGFVTRTVGVCLVLRPTVTDVTVAACLGVVVGLLSNLFERSATLQTVLPFVAAVVVSLLTFLLAGGGWIDPDLRAMIAPLVSFIPGGTLTTGVVELAAGETVAGASRLVGGVVQLVLLGFGVIVGATLVEPGAAIQLVTAPQNLLGWWAPWVGVALIALGTFVALSAPRGALPWLLLVLVSARLGQEAGNALLGTQLGGFVGAVVMTLVAYAVAATPGGPPVLVTFLPGFWLLVPGSLGFIGVTESIVRGGSAAAASLVATVNAVVSIALGVLCGAALWWSLRDAWRRALAAVAH
jgi:uncharacterized membrane protein YjjP (DUF1212 family)